MVDRTINEETSAQKINWRLVISLFPMFYGFAKILFPNFAKKVESIKRKISCEISIRRKIKKGWDINAVAEERTGRSALHLAVYNGELELVNCLIRNGADLNNTNTYPVPPLYTALAYRKVNEAWALINAGANTTVNHHGETLLHLAVKIEDPEFLQHLLNAKENPNITDPNGNTPLHLVVKKAISLSREINDGEERIIPIYHKYLKCIDYLVIAGANPSIQNSQGRTPLGLALVSNNSEITKRIPGTVLNTIKEYAREYARRDPKKINSLRKAQILAMLAGDRGKIALEAIETTLQHTFHQDPKNIGVFSFSKFILSGNRKKVIHLKNEKESNANTDRRNLHRTRQEHRI